MNWMDKKKENKAKETKPPVAPVVERNIKSLVSRQIKEERKKPVQERIAEAIGRFTGNIIFAYTHAIIFGVWIMWNIGWLGLEPFDPPSQGCRSLGQ